MPSISALTYQVSFSLVAAENILLLCYSLLTSVTVNAVILSNTMQALLCTGLVWWLLFGFRLVLMSVKGYGNTGIYAVAIYLWTFTISLDDSPHLVEKLVKLRDIGKRVSVET